jgi:hypothetical protein
MRRSFSGGAFEKERDMPYISGVLTGILLIIAVVFLIDHVNDDPASRDIVNWDLVGEELGSSVKTVGEEVRQEVHEATAPDTTPDHADETPAPPANTP